MRVFLRPFGILAAVILVLSGASAWCEEEVAGEKQAEARDVTPYENLELFTRVMEVVKDKYLEDVDLSQTEVGDRALKYLADKKRLKRLNLWSTTTTDKGLAEIASLSELTWLNLDNTQVTDEGLVHLESLTSL